MTHFTFAARSHIRNAVLCALATLTLAACGSEDGSSSAAAASSGSDSVASLVSPNVGSIDRSSEVTTPISAATAAAGSKTATTTSGTTSSSSTASISGSTTTTTSGSGTTVASTNKGSTPVKTTTTTGVATLDWMPPTENSDGSALTNLAGYTVYYGTSPSNLTQSLKVTNPGLSAYTMTNLSSGTWYFAVTSYSSAGVESTRSGTVSTTI
jgi:hypothetical protein